MQPIFNELIQMWHDHGVSLPIENGTYWLDKQIIKAFSPNGQLVNLFRIIINEDLSISVRNYQRTNSQIRYETWEETAKRFEERLHQLQDESLTVIRKSLTDYSEHDAYVLNSTGKDSQLVTHLCKLVRPDMPVVFNNTSLDCPDTYKMVKSHNDWYITNPDEGFYQYIGRVNFIPTRFARACCRIFKEGAHINSFNHVERAIWFLGIRHSESTGRSGREIVSKNPNWKNDWLGVHPILEWTDLDLWLYTLTHGIEINPKYLKGYARVGCAIACPFYTKTTWILDRYWYPTMYKRWHDILEKEFVKNNRWLNLNCTKEEYHSSGNGGLLRVEPNDEVITEFMRHMGISDSSIAKQYFNKTCYECSKPDKLRRVNQKDTIAMNMKLLGRDTEKFLCKTCLMKKLGWSDKEWHKQVTAFKNQGCTLFN